MSEAFLKYVDVGTLVRWAGIGHEGSAEELVRRLLAPGADLEVLGADEREAWRGQAYAAEQEAREQGYDEGYAAAERGE